MQDLEALQNLVNFIGDVAKDSMQLEEGQSWLQKIANYENLLPDLIALIETVKEIPAEAKSLQPDDYMTLIQTLADRIALPASHAANIVDASLKLAHNLVEVTLPNVFGVINAVKGDSN